jgi:hypothetical protein
VVRFIGFGRDTELTEKKLTAEGAENTEGRNSRENLCALRVLRG